MLRARPRRKVIAAFGHQLERDQPVGQGLFFPGEFGLGRMYADGAGVPRNPVLALEWYRKAERQNHAPTLDALARAYRTGDLGLTKDPDQANALDARVRTIRQAQGKDAR